MSVLGPMHAQHTNPLDPGNPEMLDVAKKLQTAVDSKSPSGSISDVVSDATSGPSPVEHVPSKNDNLIEDIFKKSDPQDIIKAAQVALTKATNSDSDLKNLLQQIIDAHKIELTLQKSDQFKTLDQGKKNEMVIQHYVLYKEQRESQEEQRKSQGQSATPDSDLTVEKFLESELPNVQQSVETILRLRNLGNTCFMNAAFRALQQMEGFKQRVESTPNTHEILFTLQPKPGTGKPEIDLKTLKHSLLNVLNGNSDEQNLETLIDQISRFPSLTKGSQDASNYVIKTLCSIFGYNSDISVMLNASNTTTLQTVPTDNITLSENSTSSPNLDSFDKHFFVTVQSELDSVNGNFFGVTESSDQITFNINGKPVKCIGSTLHIGEGPYSGHYVYAEHKSGTKFTIYDDSKIYENAQIYEQNGRLMLSFKPKWSDQHIVQYVRPETLVCEKIDQPT